MPADCGALEGIMLGNQSQSRAHGQPNMGTQVKDSELCLKLIVVSLWNETHFNALSRYIEVVGM